MRVLGLNWARQCLAEIFRGPLGRDTARDAVRGLMIVFYIPFFIVLIHDFLTISVVVIIYVVENHQ